MVIYNHSILGYQRVITLLSLNNITARGGSSNLDGEHNISAVYYWSHGNGYN